MRGREKSYQEDEIRKVKMGVSSQMSIVIRSLCLVLALAPIALIQGDLVQRVTPSCDPDARECEFRWSITKQETMVWYNRTEDKGYPVLVRNGTFYRRLPDNCTDLEPLSEQRE